MTESPTEVPAPEVAVGAVVAVGGVVLRGREILLIQRRRPPARGEWSIPGGRVRFGETLEAAVAREVQEETGLDVRVGRFLGWVERMGREPVPYHFVILDFMAAPTVPAQPLRPGDDAADAAWVPVDRLHEIELVAGLAEFLSDSGALPG